MNRRILSLLTFIFLIFTPCVVFSDDGTLNIDTNIRSGEKSDNDVQFVEQETDFSKLFLSSTNMKVEEKQKEKEQQGIENRGQIFLMQVEQQDFVKSYKSMLFTSDVSLSNHEGHTTLMTEQDNQLSWEIILIGLVAFGIMTYSVYRAFSRNRNQYN